MTPSAPPTRAMSALSTRSGRMSAQRSAPSAARTASSRLRDVPRASMRLATLAQAMSSTKATAPSKSHKVVCTSSTCLDCSGHSFGSTSDSFLPAAIWMARPTVLHVGARLLDGDAVLEAADAVHAGVRAALVARHRVELGERHVDRRLVVEAEARRQDADDGEGAAARARACGRWRPDRRSAARARTCRRRARPAARWAAPRRRESRARARAARRGRGRSWTTPCAPRRARPGRDR